MTDFLQAMRQKAMQKQRMVPPSGKAKQVLDRLHIRVTKIKPATHQILANICDLQIPKPGEQLRIRTQQQLNLLSVVLALIDKHEIIDELVIASFAVNREAFDVLSSLLQARKIKTLKLFCASSYKYRDRNYYKFLISECRRLAKKHNIALVFAWLHLKITLIKAGNNFYQIEGSMNFSTNTMAEQILFENNRETYAADFEFLTTTLLDQNNKALEIVV